MFLFVFLLNLLIALVALYAVANVIKWFKKRALINQITGPPTHYVIGNVMDVMGQPGEYFYILPAKYQINNK